MKILIAPNYYKGSLSAANAAEIIAHAASNKKNIEKIICPIADGGDGTIDAINYSRKGKLISTSVNDPLFRKINTNWLYLQDSNTAVIEAAKANGISLLNHNELNPYTATSYGVGELINDALNYKCKNIILTVGGSATNDAGFGTLKALGVEFLDINGNPIKNNVIEFSKISSINIEEIRDKFQNIDLKVATDVDNPLTGLNGASYIFAEQKGARHEDLKILDNSLCYLADKLKEKLGRDNRNIPGTGAAGGLAYGLSEVFNAEIIKGFDFIAEEINLEDKIKLSDIVITGEGKLDKQSLSGKAPIRIAELAKKYNKPCIAIVGSVDKNVDYSGYFDKVYSLTNKDVSSKNAIQHTKVLLLNLANNVLKDISK